jgi:hypothetical protein
MTLLSSTKTRTKPFVFGILLGCSITSIGGVYAALPIFNQQFPMIELMMSKMDHVKQQLNLSSSQQLAWQRAAEASKQLASATKSELTALRGDAQRVLAKNNTSTSELRQFFAQLDGKRDANIAERRVIREQWLTVYDQLTPEQQRQLRITLKDELRGVERLHQRFSNDKS